MRRHRRKLAALWLSPLLLSSACESEDEAPPAPRPFDLRFEAVANGQAIGCTTPVSGLGPNRDVIAGISDLRFYISNVKLFDDQGGEVPLQLDQNEFQYQNGNEQVTLIDLTSNTEGSCTQNAIAFAEGTARVNSVLRGTTTVERVRRISFEVGVPQALMKQVIASNTQEGAPSPLAEMYWTWATGYRHFVLNVQLKQGNEQGGGYLHIGSRDCGPKEGKALEDREACTFVNTPKAEFQVEALDRSKIVLDIPAILGGFDYRSPIYDPKTFEVIGEGLGLECHSAPNQADCAPLFSGFGVDLSNGFSLASLNRAFSLTTIPAQ